MVESNDESDEPVTIYKKMCGWVSNLFYEDHSITVAKTNKAMVKLCKNGPVWLIKLLI